MNTERTEAGDQFVMPGCEASIEAKLASLERLIGETREKFNAAHRKNDQPFADSMGNEVERLFRQRNDLLDPALSPLRSRPPLWTPRLTSEVSSPWQ